MTCPPRRSPALSGVDLHLGCRGDLVVHGAAVELRPGRVTALVGANGSGKSTLLRAVARLLLGALLVCLADAAGRTMIAPAQLPAGLLTAVVGTPYFVWLLWRSRTS